MTMPYVTGPVHVYVATRCSFPGNNLLSYPNANQIDYLGTGEFAPDIIKQPKFDPVYNDIGGSLPFDYLFQGEEAAVPITLTKFNWNVLYKINALPDPTELPGRYQSYDIGSLMVTEGLAYALWCHFPYYSDKTIFSTANMVAGYHFFASWADSVVVSGGTKANKVRVNFKCIRVYQPSSIDNGWYLFDHTMTNIPRVPPTAATGAVS